MGSIIDPSSWLAVALVLSLCLGGCRKAAEAPEGSATPEASAAEGAGSGAVVREAAPPDPEDGAPTSFPDGFVWMGVDPASIDPARVQDMAAWWVVLNVAEGLTAFPPDNGPVRAGVAELPPSVSEDGLTWTFSLRADARWSDGRPVVADDFVYAWRRVVDPATASKVADDLRILVNAPELASGASTELTALGVDAPDERTLVLRLRHPVPTLLDRLATPAFLPVRRDVVRAHGAAWTKPEHHVGNGPFRLHEWAERERIVFVKSATYWDADAVALERSTMRLIESEDLAWSQYERGGLHWLRTVPAERVSSLLAGDHPELILSPMLCSLGVQLNTRRPPFDDVRVRRAFARALDRERLTKQVLGRADLPTTSYIPEVLRHAVGYEPASGFSFDPEEARQELADAGYPGGAGFPEVTYVFNTYEANRVVAEFLQRSLREELGIRVRLENMEFRSWVDRVRAGDFELSRHSLCGQADPGPWLDVFRSGGDSNTVGLRDPELDRLLTRIEGIASLPDQLALARQGEQRVLDSAAIIPLYSPVRPYLVKPFVRGFHTQAMDLHPLRYIRLHGADRGR